MYTETPEDADASIEDILLLARFFDVMTVDRSIDGSPDTLFCVGETVEDSKALNGQTAFCRHDNINGFQLGILERFGLKPKTEKLRILDSPISIACTTNSFAALALSRGFTDVTVEGFDRSKEFTALARLRKYPNSIVKTLHPASREIIFEAASDTDAFVAVRKQVRDCVKIFEPTKFQDFEMRGHYDVVSINQLFQYLSASDADDVLRRVVDAKPSIISYTFNGVEHKQTSLDRDYIPFYKLLDNTAAREMFSSSADVLDVMMNYGLHFRKTDFNFS